MRWLILNANRYRWGSETYPTEQSARDELKRFFKGVNGVRLDRFYIEPDASTLAPPPY